MMKKLTPLLINSKIQRRILMNNEKTNQSEHDLQVSKFFANLYKSKRGFVDHSYFDAASPGPKKRFISVERFIETKPWKDYNNKNNFFGVATRKSEENSKKANLLEASCFFVDLDCGTEGHKNKSLHLTKETGLEYIKKFPISPTVIIDSGNGYHLYWFLTQPYDLSTTDGIYEFESVNKCLSYFLMGDTTHDAGRILRIPGTLNHKTVPPKECQIIEANYDTKYDFDVLKNHQIIKIGKKIIKDKKIQQLLSRFDDEKYPTRSEQDWALVNALIKNGLDDDEIYTLFDSFPQSGKNLDKGGRAYLMKTIEKARSSISSPKAKSSVLSKDTSMGKNINPDNVTFSWKSDPEEIGYYCTDSDGNEIRLSNFTIKYNYFQKLYEEDNYQTSIFCTIYTKTRTYYNAKINSKVLSSQNKFIENLYGITGPNSDILNKFLLFKSALTLHNQNTPEIFEVDFGYDAELKNYYTPDFIINKDDIVNKESLIRCDLKKEKDDLRFQQSTQEEVVEIIRRIENEMFTWTDVGTVLVGLAYTVTPLIYPFFESSIDSKPYMFFLGESSSGKTEFARMLQRFYKSTGRVIPVTSTPNSLGIYGYFHKDCIVVFDDLKLSNFSSDYEHERLSTLIQNYADGNGKQRATKDLKIQKDFPIRGNLILTGEDIILNQVSTIARGTIVEFKKLADNPELTERVKKLSQEFNKLTPILIQNILSYDGDFSDLEKEATERVNQLLNQEIVSSVEIISRIRNNLKLLYMAYMIFEKTFSLRAEYRKIFEEKLQDITRFTLKFLEDVTPDKVFIREFFEALENRRMFLYEINSSESNQYSPCVGHYKIEADGQVKIQININQALLALNKDRNNLKLRGKEKLIKKKLESQGYIYTPNSGKVKIADQKAFQGSWWIGEFPTHILTERKSTLQVYDPNNPNKEHVQAEKSKLEKESDEVIFPEQGSGGSSFSRGF